MPNEAYPRDQTRLTLVGSVLRYGAASCRGGELVHLYLSVQVAYVGAFGVFVDFLAVLLRS